MWRHVDPKWAINEIRPSTKWRKKWDPNIRILWHGLAQGVRAEDMDIGALLVPFGVPLLDLGPFWGPIWGPFWDPFGDPDVG